MGNLAADLGAAHAEHPADHDRAALYGARARQDLPFPLVANPRPYELFTLVPGLAGLLESIGGALIALGLFTRPVAFVLAGEMAFAYFMSHAPRGFYPLLNAGDAAILYCFIFLYFFVVGAGVWSLDQLWATRSAAGSGD